MTAKNRWVLVEASASELLTTAGLWLFSASIAGMNAGKFLLTWRFDRAVSSLPRHFRIKRDTSGMLNELRFLWKCKRMVETCWRLSISRNVVILWRCICWLKFILSWLDITMIFDKTFFLRKIIDFRLIKRWWHNPLYRAIARSVVSGEKTVIVSQSSRLWFGVWFNDRVYIDIIQIYDLPAVLCRMKFTFELTSGSSCQYSICSFFSTWFCRRLSRKLSSLLDWSLHIDCDQADRIN